jgi:ankyrin repeat protein
MAPKLVDGAKNAVHQGIEPVRILLRHKADPNFRSKAGLAPLHHAAQSEYARDIGAALLDSGADVNIRDNDGRTPLDHAKDLGLDRMVEFLTSKGARSGKN